MSSNHNPELSIVILCYKEGEAIHSFVERVISNLEEKSIHDYQIILVANYHDKSLDITPKVAADLAAQNPRIIYTAKPKKGMMGWDMKSGLELARGNYISVIDGDGQMPVEDLILIYQIIKTGGLDFVKTYRIQRGDSLRRKTISGIYNFLFNLFFPGIKSRDVNSKPKIITRAAYNLLKLESNDWFIDAEIIIQARRLNFRCAEISTNFYGLNDRRSFVNWSTILEFIKNLIIFRIKEFKLKNKVCKQS